MNVQAYLKANNLECELGECLIELMSWPLYSEELRLLILINLF